MHAVQYSHLGLIEVRAHIIDVHAAGRLDRGCELPETEGAAVARCDCDFRHVLLMRREPQGRRLFRGKRADCYCFVVTFVDLRIASAHLLSRSPAVSGSQSRFAWTQHSGREAQRSSAGSYLYLSRTSENAFKWRQAIQTSSGRLQDSHWRARATAPSQS